MDDENRLEPTIPLSHLTSRIRDLLRQEKVKWVPKLFKLPMIPKVNGPFPVPPVTAFVSNTGFISLSIIEDEAFWAGISQMILYIFQAYCACSSRRKSTKPQGNEENSSSNDITPTSSYFCHCTTVGALSAIVFAIVYPYHKHASTGFSFVANLFQVLGIISSFICR